MPQRIRVVAALIEKEGKFLIAQREGDDAFAGKWEFPGGKVREGESDEEALRREIREELGVDVKVGSLFGETDHDYQTLSVHLCFYWCEIPRDVSVEPTEHRALLWVIPTEFGQYDFLEADQPVLKGLAMRSRVFSSDSRVSDV